MSNLVERLEAAMEQLVRYGGEPYSEKLVEIVEAVDNLNDDLHHGRNPKVIKQVTETIRQILDEIERDYELRSE